MNRFYDKLELYLNRFVSSRKCIGKTRVGSKYKRIYGKTKTLYRRVLEHEKINQEIKDRLKQAIKKLNPLLLKWKVDKMISEIFKLQKRYSGLNFMRRLE